MPHRTPSSRTRPFVFALRLLAVAAFLVASLSGGSASADTLRIGVAVPLSGPSARVGDEVAKVARWWARKARTEHGLDVEVVVRDTTFKPADAVAAVERLVLEDKVSAITGMHHSAQGIAVVPLAKRLGVPIVLMGSSSPKVMYGPDNINAKDFAWRASIDDTIKGNLLGSFLVSVVATKFHGVQKVFYIGENTDFAKDFLDATRSYVQKNGQGRLENVGSPLYFEPNAPTLISELARVRAANPGIVVAAPSGGILGVFTNEFRELRVPALDIGYAGEAAAQEYVDLTGDNRWGTTFIVYTTPGKAMTSLTLAWEKEFAKEIPDYPQPGPYSAMTWEALESIRHARTIAGSNDPKAINAAMPKVSFEGVRNRTVQFDATTHDLKDMFVAIAQYQQGSPGLGFRVVFPSQVADAEFILPQWVRP